MNAVEAIGKAVGTHADANADSQSTTAFWLITLMTIYVPLTQNYLKVLAQDQRTYFIDSLSVVRDPKMAAKSAADYQEYTMDSNAMDLDTGTVNNLIANGKSQVRTLGNTMDGLYALEEPIVQLLKSTTSIIVSF